MVLLTVEEVQAQLKVSRSCVYTLIAQGKLACVRIGVGRGTIRVERSELESFVDRCRSVPKAKMSHRYRSFEHLDGARLSEAWKDKAS